MSEQVKKYQMSDVLLNPSMAVLFMPKFVVSHDDYAALQAECDRYKSAFNEWHDKTEWVQRTATAKDLGKHRADVLRERIDNLQAECERLQEMVAERDSAIEQLSGTAVQNGIELELLSEKLAALKGQFGELHKARNLLSKLSSAGFDIGGDAAESILAMCSELAALKAQEPVAVMYEDGGILSRERCGSTFYIICRTQTPLYTLPTINKKLTVRDENKD